MIFVTRDTHGLREDLVKLNTVYFHKDTVLYNDVVKVI
jgi:hypothetical protein